MWYRACAKERDGRTCRKKVEEDGTNSGVFNCRCGLPQCLSCSQIKEDDSIHLEECSLLTDNQRKFNFKSIDEATKVYSMVTILRLLLLKDWDEFETHSSERTDSPIWLFNNKFVVPLISNLKNKDGQAFSAVRYKWK